MKRLNITIIILLIGWQFLSGQNQSAGLDYFRSEILPQYKGSFSSAVLDENGQLRLNATPGYGDLTLAAKLNLMTALLKSWKESLVMVYSGSQRELWGWNSEKNNARLMDAWDLNPEPIPAGTETAEAEIARHPWFFYIGGAQQMDSFKNISGALNVRTGFFLLNRKLDLAVSLTEALSGNIEDESASLVTSIGVGSKYYFPLRKNNLSPNLGAELAVSIPTGGSVSFTPSMLAGISWFVGPGCLDAGLRIGRSSMMMFGYTLIPKLKSGK